MDPEGSVTKEILPVDRTRASCDFMNKQIKVQKPFLILNCEINSYHLEHLLCSE